MDIPKTFPGPNTHFFGLEYEQSGNQVPHFEFFETYFKVAHEISVQNGSGAFPNELMRFRFEAKPILYKIRKQCKHAVINKRWL